jgi:hypothetical protein
MVTKNITKTPKAKIPVNIQITGTLEEKMGRLTIPCDNTLSGAQKALSRTALWMPRCLVN